MNRRNRILVFHDSQCNTVANVVQLECGALVNNELLSPTFYDSLEEEEKDKGSISTIVAVKDFVLRFSNKDHHIRYHSWSSCGRYKGVYDRRDIHQYVEGTECHVDCGGRHDEIIEKKVEGGCVIL